MSVLKTTPTEKDVILKDLEAAETPLQATTPDTFRNLGTMLKILYLALRDRPHGLEFGRWAQWWAHNHLPYVPPELMSVQWKNLLLKLEGLHLTPEEDRVVMGLLNPQNQTDKS